LNNAIPQTGHERYIPISKVTNLQLWSIHYALCSNQST
jgi:hypothetical protein